MKLIKMLSLAGFGDGIFGYDLHIFNFLERISRITFKLIQLIQIVSFLLEDHFKKKTYLFF